MSDNICIDCGKELEEPERGFCLDCWYMDGFRKYR